MHHVIKNIKTGQPEFVSGLGSTIEEAVEDLLKYFDSEVQAHKPNRELKLDDFIWSAPEDF